MSYTIGIIALLLALIWKLIKIAITIFVVMVAILVLAVLVVKITEMIGRNKK